MVSILIPVFNREKYIQETILSAVNQNYDDFEVIVIDNNSSDDTWNIVTGLASKYKLLKIHRNEENIGPVRNWIKCLSYASGDYVKILWSDDLMDENYLSQCVPHFNEDVSFVYSAAKIFNESGSNVIRYINKKGEKLLPDEFIEKCMLDGDVPFSPGCAIFRIADVEKHLVPNIPNKLKSEFAMHAIGNDLLLMLLCSLSRKHIVTVNKPLSLFRSHKDSISTQSSGYKLKLFYLLTKIHFIERVLPHQLRKYEKKFYRDYLILKYIKGAPIVSYTDLGYKLNRTNKFILILKLIFK